MPSVCECPFCGQTALIPEDLDSEAAVLCPHCQYEFSGDRAWMYAVEAPPEHVAELPPALIPVLASEGVAAALPPSCDGQSPAGEEGSDGRERACCVAAEIDAASTNEAADRREPEAEASQTAPAQADEIQKATEPRQPADEEPDVAATLPAGGEGESPGEPSGEPASGSEPSQPDAEISPHGASGGPVAIAESCPASDTSAAGPIETEVPAEAPAADSAGPSAASAPSTEAPGEATSPSPDRPSPAWPKRRKRNPVRTAVGVVISGLLGLAVPYGAWLGLSKLGLVGRPRPAAATRNHAPADSRPARPDSTMVPPPQPTGLDEWPGLDENRFAAEPKEPKKEEKPSERTSKGKK